MEKFLEKIAIKLVRKAENTESIVKVWFYFFILSVLNNIVYAFYIDQKALGKKIWLEIFTFLSLSAVAVLLKIDILILPAFAVAVFLFTPSLRNILYLGTALAVYLSILVTVSAYRIGFYGRPLVIVALFSFITGYGLVNTWESIVSFYRKSKNFFNKITKRLGLAVVIILVFSASNAFAFNPSHVTFYTYGGFDAIYDAFHSIALIFSDHAYQGLFFTVMALSLFIAGFRNYVQSLQGRTTGNILSWSMPVLISFALYVALIVPKGQVTIYDTVLNKTADVGGIPIGVTTMAGIASEVENGIITMIDTLSINRETDYENSAGGIGVMTIMNMAMHGVRSSDVYLDRSVKRYITDCFFYDLNNPDGWTKYQDVINSTQPLSTLLSNAAHYNSIYTVYYDSSNNAGKTMTCHDAWTNISAKLNSNANFQTSLKNICASAGIDTTNFTALTHCKDVITSYLNVLYDGQDSAVTGDAMDFIRQDYVAHELYMASVDADANFLVNYKITNAGMNMGMAFNNWIPTIRAVLIALGLSILPFLIIFLPTPFYGKILGGMAGVFVFMVSWSAIDATIHHFLVGEAAVLFQSVLIHNVGYGAFETMSTPLQHTMAAWGYIRSLGMGLAVIATGLVTKTGAYGLQMAAGRMESAVASQASSIGEETTNPTEQGSLADKMVKSTAFSEKIAPAYTMRDLIKSEGNLKAKQISSGLQGSMEDYETAGAVESSLQIGKDLQTKKIADQAGTSVRDVGRVLAQTSTGTAVKEAQRFNKNNIVDAAGRISNITARYNADTKKGQEKYMNAEGDNRVIQTTATDSMIRAGAAGGIKRIADTLFHGNVKEATDFTGYYGEVRKFGSARAMQKLYSWSRNHGYNGSFTEFMSKVDEFGLLKNVANMRGTVEPTGSMANAETLMEKQQTASTVAAQRLFKSENAKLVGFVRGTKEAIDVESTGKAINNYGVDNLVNAEVAKYAHGVAAAKTDENIATNQLNVPPLASVEQKILKAETAKAGVTNLATPAGEKHIAITPQGKTVTSTTTTGKTTKFLGGMNLDGLKSRLKTDILSGNYKDLHHTLETYRNYAELQKPGSGKKFDKYAASEITDIVIGTAGMKRYIKSSMGTGSNVHFNSNVTFGTPKVIKEIFGDSASVSTGYETHKSDANSQESIYNRAQNDIYNKLINSPDMAKTAINIEHNPGEYLPKYSNLNKGKKSGGDAEAFGSHINTNEKIGVQDNKKVNEVLNKFL